YGSFLRFIVQVEEPPHKVNDGGRFRIARSSFQSADGGVHDLVDDTAGQCFDRQFLVGGHRTQAAANSINLGLTNGFEVVLQADDGGNHVESLEASLKLLDLAIDDGLRLFRFLPAVGYVRSNRLLQVVDVIDENAIEFVHLRIDIAGNGNIDEEHGLVLAPRHEFFAMFAPEDEVGRSGRGNNDIGALAGVVKPAE